MATVYADAPDAHWERNPMAYRIKRYRVDACTVLKIAWPRVGEPRSPFSSVS